MNTDEQLKQGIQDVLKYLPRFEEPSFVFGSLTSSESGKIHLNGFQMSNIARTWGHAVYESGLMLEGFDWGNWQKEAHAYLKEPERMETANLDTLRKLLTTHLRKDRFCEGHLATMYECGHLTAIMRRLEQIVDQMEGLS